MSLTICSETSLNSAIAKRLVESEDIIKLNAGISLTAHTARREIIGKICSLERLINVNITAITETPNTAINSRNNLGVTLIKYEKKGAEMIKQG